MTEICVSISARMNLSILEVLKMDIDDFGLLLNYCLQKEPEQPREKAQDQKAQMIKVDNKTATGGWW